MIKTIAAFITLAAIAAASPSYATDMPIKTFDAPITFDSSANLDDTYMSVRKQARRACKNQIKTVKSLSIRVNFLQTCTAELLDQAVVQIDNTDLKALHAAKLGKTRAQKYAQIIQ